MFLGALANNGGFVETHALLAGSDGIDQGATVVPGTTTDARGFIVNDTRRDLGAFEHNAMSTQSQNNAPVVDLDSTTTGLDFSTSFQAGGNPVSIVNGASISDIDSTIQFLTVTISGQQSPQEFINATGPPIPGIDVSASSFFDGSGFINQLVYRNEGTATNADFQTLLDSLEYRNVDPGATGVRILEFVANDGVQDSMIATTTVNIVEVNDVPTLSGLGPNVSFTEDGFAVILDDDVILSDPELLAADNYDGATLSIERVGQADAEDLFSNTGSLGPLTEGDPLVYNGVTVGAVNLNSGGELELQFNSAATHAIVNDVASSIAYANSSDNPPASVDLAWTFNDQNNGSQGTGGAESVSSQITVDITAVNDAPITTPVVLSSITEDSSARLITQAELLTNAGDIDGDNLTAAGLTVTSGNGTLVDNNDGTFSYTPDANDDTQVSFEYTIFDGTSNVTANATLDILAVNDAPTNLGGLPTDITATEDIVSAIDLSLIDLSDVDGDTNLTLVVETVLGNLNASPFPGVTVSGSGTNSITLSGTVSSLNALLNDTSVITYLGPNNLSGDNVDTISIMVNDNGNIGAGGGGLIDLGTANIDLTAVNNAPTGISPDSTTLSENIDTTGGIVALVLDTADVDVGDSFTYSIVGGGDAGNFSIVGNQLIFDAGALNFEAQDSYEVSVRTTDSGGLSHVETLTVFVSDQNDAPVVVLNQGAVVNEGSTITIDNALLQTTDEDQNSASPTYLITGAPSVGTLLINGVPATTGTTFTQADIDAGLVSYSHSGSEASLDGFTFDILENSNLAVAGQTFSIVIFPVNNNPIADNDSFQVDEDTSLTGNVITNSDTDVENDILTATLVNGPINADAFLLNPDGSFTYTPVENFHGTDTFEYQIADGNGGFDTATVVITVQSINDSPIANSDSFGIISGQDSSVAGNVLLNDIDVDGDVLMAILVDSPANGTLTFDTDGNFVYTPSLGFFGVDTFTYLASDGVETSATSVEINVSMNGLRMQSPPMIFASQAFEPTGEPLLEEAGDNPSQSEEEENSNNVAVNAIPTNRLGNVSVLNLTDQIEFQAEEDSQDLIKLMTNRGQARAVLGSILTNVSSIQVNVASTDVAVANELDEFKNSNSGIQTIFNAGFLSEEIASQVETDESFDDFKITIGAVTGIGSLGYILWTLRGGALMAVALAQLPSWRMIDPLPILDSYVSGAAGGADQEFDDFFG